MKVNPSSNNMNYTKKKKKTLNLKERKTKKNRISRTKRRI